MNKTRIYLDYNAAAPLRPSALQKMIEVLSLQGNAASIHSYGRCLSQHLEEARRHVAHAVGAQASNVIFTSCGSEANNLILQGFESQGFRLLICATDHPSTRLVSEKAILIPVDSQGIIDQDILRKQLQISCRTLVSIHFANNETGIIQPIPELARLVKARGAFLHTDAVQAFGRVPVNLEALGVDALTLASSKIGGPLGAAALILKDNIPFPSLIRGGAQEKNRRAGTHNVPAIAGFGMAVQEAKCEEWHAIESLRNLFEQSLPEAAEIYGHASPRLPNTSLVRLPHISNEIQLMNFDLEGFAVSAGAACSSGKIGASPVLDAMGIPLYHARETTRVSLCLTTTKAEIEAFIKAWFKLYERCAFKAKAA